MRGGPLVLASTAPVRSSWPPDVGAGQPDCTVLGLSLNGRLSEAASVGGLRSLGGRPAGRIQLPTLGRDARTGRPFYERV